MIKKDKSEVLKISGNNLKRARESKGYTQEHLAIELDLEISQISRIERGVINTSIYTLFLIANILELDINELFILEDNNL